jgi:hypothetical protein
MPTDTDESTAADLERLRRLEQRMLDRGYLRSRYGFWVAPGTIGIESRTDIEDVEDDETGED